MTKQTQVRSTEEAMKLALEATLEALRFSLHVGFDESSESQIKKADKAVQQHQKAITALQEALASEAKEQPAQQWNAGVPSLYPEPEPGVSIKATYEQPAQPQQEPVGYADKIAFEGAMKAGKGCDVWPVKGDYEARTGRDLIALYTSPPAQRTWVGLTDEEQMKIINSNISTGLWFMAIEIAAKLKEKNT